MLVDDGFGFTYDNGLPDTTAEPDWYGYADLTPAEPDWSGYGNLTNQELSQIGTADGAGAAVGPTSGISKILQQLGNVVKTNGAYDLAKLASLGAGLYATTKSNNNTQAAGYQGGIPNLVATRQAPGPDGKLSGNVTYTRKAAGGLLESGGFVIPADVVSHLGNGSSEAGLRILADRLGAAPIKGQGDGMSDSIKTTIDGQQPARVANEEARLTKAQVEAAGGAKKLYAMMDQIRRARTGSKEQGKQIDPSKFVPGGEVKGYAVGGTTGTTVPTGTTGTEQNIASWAGPYVTNMLGQGSALAAMPFEQYGGPLTAGPSDLQNKVFSGLQGANFPSQLGQTFSSSTAPTIGADGQPTGGGGIASNYMNPYIANVLNPQLAEMRRQSQANLQPALAQLTKAGGYGGGRQAIMESEANRNLLQEQDKLVGQGYATAYDKGMGQFNAEQTQGRDLASLMGQQGNIQRGIETEDVAADKAQFEEARLNPYKMVQFQQSLLSGLPLAAQTFNQAPTNNLTQFSQGSRTVSDLLKALGVTA